MFFVNFIFFITVNGQTVRVQSPVAIQGFVLLLVQKEDNEKRKKK